MMSAITKSAFLAAVCLISAAGFAAASQAGFNATDANALVSPAGEADRAPNVVRLDGATLKSVPDDVWAKDTDPPEPD